MTLKIFMIDNTAMSLFASPQILQFYADHVLYSTILKALKFNEIAL